jgi:carbon-monoxide dehydrogenase large subunit
MSGVESGPAGDAGAETDADGREAPTERREDPALLRGEAAFTDDLVPDRAAHLALVRSPHGHAVVEGVDATDAEALDDVLAVHTFEDLDVPGLLPIADERLDVDVPAHPVLARDRVRYDGQPVAAVLAETAYAARDGARAVDVACDPLPATVDPREAREADVTIFEGAPDNVALDAEMGDADATDAAFADADHVVDVDLENNRLLSSALEPRAAVAEPGSDEHAVRVTLTSQSAHGHRRKLAHTLGMDEGAIHVRAPSVGGGFGHKGHHHPGEALAAWAAMREDRPVAWSATRSANYREGAHGRDHRTTAELAVDDDGTLRALRAETDAAVGGYCLGGGGVMAAFYGRLLAGQYDLDAVHCRTRCVFTTTAPVHSYRGAGRPEAIYVVERLVDAAARDLGFDPVELRRRNLVEEFPHETAVGAEYDSGNYARAMDRALDHVDGRPATTGDAPTADDAPAADRDAPTADDAPAADRDAVTDDDGLLRGVGVASYVESTGGGFESGVVRVDRDGGVTVLAGTHSHGQGHGTTYASVVADEMGIDPDRIDVVEGDTARIPTGTGTFGSRSAIVGGNAVAESAREVAAKARRVAAGELDADPADVTLVDGEYRAGGDAVAFEAVARAAYGRQPDGMEPGLEATTFYEADGTAYTFGTHACAVAVDPATGDVDVERYVAVDDPGHVLNPTIVDGQIHGGVAQGLGQALSERATYADDGTLLTDRMTEYALPRAGDLPAIETDRTETPSPHNDLGVKGVGEAGTIAAPPTVVNAVVDALAPLGVAHLDMPLTPERVRAALADSR